MTSVLLAGLGGFVGSAARYALSMWVTSRLAAGASFPWGTFAVNVLGAVAIGIIMGTVMERGDLPERARLLLVVGVLGGFTTFSAFSSETFTLLRAGETPIAVAYVVASVAASLLAVWAGYAAARAIVA